MYPPLPDSPCFQFGLLSAAYAASPVSNLSVTLKGKKYDIPDQVTTAQELMERLEEASGVPSNEQGRLLFAGKKLAATDSLSDAGVADGASLSVVPAKKGGSKSKATATASAASTADTANAMEDYLKQAGVDPSQLDDLKNPENLKESLGMMNDMMKSPMFQEYMKDPEKLEQSRQMILQNPMLKSMMAGMPGMEDLLNDPVAWREAMQAAASMYQNMDPEQMMQMMGGMPGGMPGGGLFDGALNDATPSVLDELDEDD